MAKKENKLKEKGKSLWAEFKEFINKGNAFMLAVGVVLGTAFTAIVSAFTSILLNAVMAVVPGGLAGLVTPIKTSTAIAAIKEAGLTKEQLVLSAKEWANLDAALRDLFVSYGGKYYFSQMPILNWGALINALISFVIVGLVLFIIVKVVATINKKNEEIKAKALEEYYKKHPEERPEPVEEGAPEPTELDYLKEIRDLLAAKEPGK